jgi:hypothetical protein
VTTTEERRRGPKLSDHSHNFERYGMTATDLERRNCVEQETTRFVRDVLALQETD